MYGIISTGIMCRIIYFMIKAIPVSDVNRAPNRLNQERIRGQADGQGFRRQSVGYMGKRG